MGLTGHRYGTWASYNRVLPGCLDAACQRSVLFPTDGEDFCGCGIGGANE
jgi:hypothetical protein